MDDLETLMDRFLPPELQDGHGWHAGRVATVVLLGILFLVSAWRTLEFMGAVLSGTTFEYMVYVGVMAFDGALLAWHVAHDRASSPAQVGIATIMWVVALVSMLGTNLGDILWTANANALGGDLASMKTTLVNVLLLAIPILTIAHIAAGTLYMWFDPGVALALKRRRAVGESRNAMISHGAAMTKLHLRAEAARKFAEAEAEVMGYLEDAASKRAHTYGRRTQVWRTMAGLKNGGAGVHATTQAPAPAQVVVGQNGHDGNPDNIIHDDGLQEGSDPFAG